MTSKKRILSGMRPTGPLHLGNLLGALDNWITLQDQHECYFFVADWHALTSEYESPRGIKDNIRNMILDWLSAGLSPEKSTFFVQSRIKEHAELFLILSMLTPIPWLERNPTYKDQIVQLNNKDLSTFGFLGYPVLQAADIIMYKANAVPVGIDQVPHVEITREIARRFNFLYGEVFPEPESILTETPKILGLDRRKMSKSYHNAIYLGDTPDEIKKKTSEMITDPQRMRRSDPGNPDICNVFEFHKKYSSQDTTNQIHQECRSAKIGCVDCKRLMATNLIEALAPIREKRAFYVKNPGLIEEIIETGNQKARAVAEGTMADVRAAMNI
jgi:tryptophanyl-tRNA synthetase